MELTSEDRKQIDRWLAGFFLREPDAASIQLYRSEEGTALLDQLAKVPALEPLVSTMRATFAPPVDPETLRLDLAAAYGRLFLTGGPRGVPLHASAYLSERGLLNQAPTRETAAILASLGLTAPPGFKEPVDHIGLQLSILAELAGGAEADGLSEEAYLRSHLLTWVPTLAALCAQRSTVPFYRDLATSALAWLRAVEQQLSVAPAGA
ncbi:TorD/DmsD family molecular chaperone [Tropicimonas isoalkanivorans]|uniref:TorA specific chaperone n=1 Tax=Tropicimonas isoalkanivorans TaxID=441112 RepID=A0A1I1KNA8_9RHOB|nr:molecular chaperone TorD family protein [Tropicimonas isoalkanivorans]SFC62257.1 TorA specific chaperone [Tropicimonas isoalkanivorans]